MLEKILYALGVLYEYGLGILFIGVIILAIIIAIMDKRDNKNDKKQK